MKRPNKLLYVLLNRLARIYTILGKNHHFHNPQNIKVQSPSIVISNHTSFFDFLYVMWAFKNTPVNFVVARKYFETKPLSSILKFGHTIPKSLFQADTSAMKQMLEVIKIGGILGIFPEGQISMTGVTLPFPHGIGKFVKKVNVPVYAVKTTGAYLKDPPWTNNKRIGRIDSELLQVITPEESQTLTPSEIEEKLYEAIYTNPFYDHNIDQFKGNNLAKGLEDILYFCPKCHSEGKMVSVDNQLICQECNFQYQVKANGWLYYQDQKINIHDAYLQVRDYELKRILSSANFRFSMNVRVETIINHKYQIASQGQLDIQQNTINYISDDDYQFSIPTNTVCYVPFDAGRNFQIYINNKLYQFIPHKSYLPTKATIIIEELYKLNEQPVERG